MITPWQIYWITRLDSLSGLFAFCCAASVAFIILLSVVAIAAEYEEWYADYIKAFKGRLIKGVVSLMFFGLSLALTPTTKEAIAIMVIPRIANNEDLQGLGKDVIDTAREWLQEIRPKKNEKK